MTRATKMPAVHPAARRHAGQCRGLDAEAVRSALDALGPEGLLLRLGIGDQHLRRDGTGIRMPCPLHGGTNPNFSVFSRGGRIGWKCWSECDRSGDALGLVAEVRGIDRHHEFPALLAAAAEVAGVDPRSPTPTPDRRASRHAEQPLERTYPPENEVIALWRTCLPVAQDDEAATYLRSRLGDEAPALVDLFDLARVIPRDADLPRWARYRGAAAASQPWWATGHRILVPAYAADGTMRSVRAWRICEGSPKRLPPAGYRASGLVLACSLTRQVLCRGAAPEWWPADTPLDILICEGEPDFVGLATWYSDADATAPCVLGIISGSATEALASRIPPTARVTIVTHRDAAGDRYADVISRLLRGRGISTWRSAP